jgi:hypothetical protein
MSFLMAGLPAWAGEHGGQEQGGQEHGGKEHGGAIAPSTTIEPQAVQQPADQAPQETPSAQQIREHIASYVEEREEQEGAFTIHDGVTGSTRTLQLVRVHDRVGKTAGLYYACTDMRDAATGELLDLDFDVEGDGGQLDVVDVRIHKVEGQARYTYDEDDNRVPLR